jgi:hypothetical protein
MRSGAVNPPPFFENPYPPRPVDHMAARTQVQNAMAWVQCGAAIPQGEAAIRQGEAATPQGEAATPQGEAATPQGEAATPQGEAVIPTLVDLEETPMMEPEEAMAPAPAVTRPGDTHVTGLLSSRWASDGSQIRHANHFTGPAYENVRSGRSHMNDLAQLEPRTQVTGSSADLIGLDFGTSDTGMAGAGPENSQAAVDHIGQAPALTNGTHTTTDKIENLGLRMSRLTIRSPTKARVQSVTTSVAQSPDRGSVPSPGPATPTTLRPAAPVFTPNPILRPSVSPAPVMSPASVVNPAPAVNPAPVVAPQLPAQPLPAQPLAAPATQARPRGLLASRHAAGSGPSSSGNFNFHLPGAARK